MMNALVLQKSTLVNTVITTFALYRISRELNDKSKMGTFAMRVHATDAVCVSVCVCLIVKP